MMLKTVWRRMIIMLRRWKLENELTDVGTLEAVQREGPRLFEQRVLCHNVTRMRMREREKQAHAANC